MHYNILRADLVTNRLLHNGGLRANYEPLFALFSILTWLEGPVLCSCLALTYFVTIVFIFVIRFY